jgi:hypothetical protein
MPVLVVQMGHVGRPPRPGSVGTTGEQQYTRRAAIACLDLLARDGWSVQVIDADPSYETHRQLGGLPSSYRGDAFVAMHCDGSTNPSRNGASYGYRTPEGDEFAQAIKAAYLVATGREESWLEPDNYTANLSGYYGTGLAASMGNRRAVIFEAGFLTNPEDRELLTSSEGPRLAALAIGSALGLPTLEEFEMNKAQNDALAEIWQTVVSGQKRDAQINRDLGYVLEQVMVQIKAVAGSLSEQEARLLAAIKADADEVDVQQLANALVPMLPPAATEADVVDAVREAFARAGTA